MRPSAKSRARHRRMVIALWAVVAMLLVVVGVARGSAAPKPASCTHGVSSIGPVEIVDGKVVGGSTTPDTEACLH